jgi:hypothetical protein
MKRRSPTLEGFQVLFRWPALGLAEIAWRWSFSLAVVASLVFCAVQYLGTLPVTSAELFLLRTRHPALIAQALSRMFRGSAPRAVAAGIVLTVALTLGWIVLASVGRAASLRALFEYFRGKDASIEPSGVGSPSPRSGASRLAPLMGLNSLRAAVALATVVGTVGALVLAAASSSETDPSPGRALLIFYVLATLVGLAGMELNWLLSLAAVFAVGEGKHTFAALAAAVNLCRTQFGRLTSVGTAFGLVHVLVFVVASSVAGLPLGFAGVLPGSAVAGGLLAVTMLYFAIVDFLYAGRLASYVCIVEHPAESFQQSPPAWGRLADDDILSDLPGLLPPEPLGN